MAPRAPTEEWSHDRPVEQQILREYGVGIDCHSRFIQICVLVNQAGHVTRVEREFSTDWGDLLNAKQWALRQLNTLTKPPSDLCYTLESTGTYHRPVMIAFEGRPSVVNPLLANPSRRKTDVLDARLLAQHAITGLWPESFVPPTEVDAVRVHLKYRSFLVAQVTRARNRAGGMLTRFGHTFPALK